MLAEIVDLNPAAIFGRIDRSGLGFASIDDIFDFLGENNIDCTSREIEQIVNEYSAGSHNLSYDDFLDIITPRAAARLRDHVLTRRNASTVGRVSSEAEHGFARLFEQELRHIRNV